MNPEPAPRRLIDYGDDVMKAITVSARSRTFSASAFAAVIWAAMSPPVFGSIAGGTGNDPVKDPGWPRGAEKFFNDASRVAWWEGPPLGGGQWHADFRGNADKLNQLLLLFAKIETPSKRVVIHEGIGYSFWLSGSGQPDKRDASRIDWSLMVWQPEKLKELRGAPVNADAIASEGPGFYLCQLDIYTGGSVRWDNVSIPDGVPVVDQRLTVRGLSPRDGAVIEGVVEDLATSRPLAATIELAAIHMRVTGGDRFEVRDTTKADDQGHWVLNRVTMGRYRIIARHDGFVPRILVRVQVDDQSHWQSVKSGSTCGLWFASSVAPTNSSNRRYSQWLIKTRNAEIFRTTIPTLSREHRDPIQSVQV